jgi:ATP-dependent Lon protease
MPEPSEISAEQSAPAPREPAPTAASAASGAAGPALPEDALIIMPVRNTVLFPGMVLPIAARRERSTAAAQAAVREQRPLGLLLQRDAEVTEPGAGDLHAVGTAARILRYLTAPDGTHNVICQGEERFRIVEFLDGHPFMAAGVG